MATDSYATDADLLLYAPDVSAVSSTLRALALDDAEQMVDYRWFGTKTRRAHAMLALHYIALTYGELGGETGTVSSRKAGDIAVTYATTPSEDTQLASTKWGRLYLEIRRSVPYSGVSA